MDAAAPATTTTACSRFSPADHAAVLRVRIVSLPRSLLLVALVCCAAPVRAQVSTWSITPAWTHAAQRDERASPLEYAGGLWGFRIARETATWSAEIGGMHGELSSSITDGDFSRESSSSVSLSGSYSRATGAWRTGAELYATSGVRVHHYYGTDAGFAELLIAAGPVLRHYRTISSGSLHTEFAASAIAVLIRPYSDARVARDGDLEISAGLPHQIAVARARITWQSRSIPLIAYDISLQRAAGDDHYGVIRHSLGVGIAVRR
jgi:hypothetical protein